MKKVLLILIALVVSVGAFAQKSTAEERAKKTADQLTTDLGLTADQNTKVYDAVLVRIGKMTASREANKGNKEAMKADAKKISKEHSATMKEILTEEQLTKLKELRAKKNNGNNKKAGEVKKVKKVKKAKKAKKAEK